MYWLAKFNCFPLFQLPRRGTNQLVQARNLIFPVAQIQFFWQRNTMRKVARLPKENHQLHLWSVPRHANYHHHHHQVKPIKTQPAESTCNGSPNPMMCLPIKLHCLLHNLPYLDISSVSSSFSSEWWNCQILWEVNIWKVDILSLDQISVKCSPLVIFILEMFTEIRKQLIPPSSWWSGILKRG